MSPYLRHAGRHLQATFLARVEEILTTLGWLGSTGPFGTTPVVLAARRMRESDLGSVAGNLVAVTFGDEGNDTPTELGGGIMATTTEVMLDVVAVNDAVGVALTADLKDQLSGRALGTNRFLPLLDYTSTATGVAVPEYRIEILDVVRHRPEAQDLVRFWHVLEVRVELTFPGEE